MSGEEFQSRYSSVMDSMLKSAVAETSQLFQTMVEELKAEMSKIKRENEELRSKCRRFEKARDTGPSCESEPGTTTRNVTGKCDTAIQCDLVPLQVGDIYSGTEEALEGEQQLESHGDGNQLSGTPNRISFEEKLHIDQPSSNRILTALQQDHLYTLEAPDTPDTSEDKELSCERGTRSQASGLENPPVVTPPPLEEKMEQQSQQISTLTLIATPTENLPETATLTKEKPPVTPVDCIAEVEISVQPDSLPHRRRGRPPKMAQHVKSSLHPDENKVQPPPTDVPVDQETENSTSAIVEKIEEYPPPVKVTSPKRGRPLKKPRLSTFKKQVEEIIKSPLNEPTAHKTVNPPSAHTEETEDHSPLPPLTEGEYLAVKPNLSKCQQLPEKIDEVTQPLPESPSVIEALETSSTELPKSLSSVQPRKRSISYPTLEDAMLLIEAMNGQTCEDDDTTIGNKSSVQTTTSTTLAEPQHSPCLVTSQTSNLVSDQQSAPKVPETSAASSLDSPTAQVKTLVIPKHYTIVSPKTTGPTAMLSKGCRITVVTPKLPCVSVTPQKIIVMPRLMSSFGPHIIPSISKTQLSTVISTVVSAQKTVVSAEKDSSPVYTVDGETSTQPTVPTVIPTQTLSSAPPQVTANSSSHSGNSLPQMIVLPQPMSVVTQQKQQSTTTPHTVLVPMQQHSAGSTKTVEVPLEQPCHLSQQPSSTVSTQNSMDNLATTATSSLNCENLTLTRTIAEESVAVPSAQPSPLSSQELSFPVYTQTSTVNLATTLSQMCSDLTSSTTNYEDLKSVAVPLRQPSPLSSQELSSPVSTQTSTVNLLATLSQKCNDLTSSKTNAEDSKPVAVPLVQPCSLSTQTSTVNLAATVSHKCDNLASCKTNAADSKMTTASTEICSSLKPSTSSTNAPTVMQLSVPPVFPKKKFPLVKLTRLSLPALRKELLKLKRCQNVPSIVQEIPVAAVESSQMSPACEQEITLMSMTSPTETQPSSKESSITVQVQNSIPPKVPTVVQEKPAAADKSSLPTSTENDESTSTQATKGCTSGCTQAPDPSHVLTDIQETPSGALLRLSSVIPSKDLYDPHLQMTKAQFLAQLAVTPVIQVQEQEPPDGVMNTTDGTDDKKGVDKNTHLKQLRSNRIPQLNPCKTKLNPVSQTEAQPTSVKAKKARLDRDGETPTKTSCPCTNKNSIPVKKDNDTHSPVSLRRSRLSKNSGSPKRTASEPAAHSPERAGFTRGGYRKLFNESTPVSGPKRPKIIQDAESPKKCRLADVKRGKTANAKTLTKATFTKRVPQAGNAKKLSHPQKLANVKRLSKATNAQKLANGKRLSKATNAQKFAAVASAENLAKAANVKTLTKATNAKTFAKAANIKNSKTTNAQKLAKAVNLQQVPKAVKAKLENEETENEHEFEHSQPENDNESEGELGQSANNKVFQTGKTFWTLPRMEARARRLSINEAINNTQAQSPPTLKQRSRNGIPPFIIPWHSVPSAPTTSSSNQWPATKSSPPNTPVTQSVPGRAPPIISPLQPLAVGRRLLKNQCGECGRILSSSEALESHVRLHTGHRPFSCQHCGKNFPDAKCLSRHGRVHRNGRIHVCAECGKGFVYTFGLTKHLQMVHGKFRPFGCQICNKGFHTRRDAQIHARIHTGEKPFDCSLCEKKFKRRTELNVHLRWHNGEKRHWCPYCGKGFLDLNNLKRHKYTHTGERPHPCAHCPKKFSQSGHLKKHLKNVHKIKSENTQN